MGNPMFFKCRVSQVSEWGRGAGEGSVTVGSDTPLVADYPIRLRGESLSSETPECMTKPNPPYPEHFEHAYPRHGLLVWKMEKVMGKFWLEKEKERIHRWFAIFLSLFIIGLLCSVGPFLFCSKMWWGDDHGLSCIGFLFFHVLP